MCVGAWSREQLAATYPAILPAMNLPVTFNKDTDVLQLPVYNNSISIFSGVGVGPDIQPGLYNYFRHKVLNQYRVFFQDVWKIRPTFTFNYGLAWNAQTGFTNTDLPLPQYLAPIVGANGLEAAPDSLQEFQSAVGFAWSPFRDNKTVIRGGGGIYWDSVPGYWRFREAALIGPPGGGRLTLSSFAFTNPLPGITNYLTGQPLPIGAPIQIQQLYNISVSQFFRHRTIRTTCDCGGHRAGQSPEKRFFSVQYTELRQARRRDFPPRFPGSAELPDLLRRSA